MAGIPPLSLFLRFATETTPENSAYMHKCSRHVCEELGHSSVCRKSVDVDPYSLYLMQMAYISRIAQPRANILFVQLFCSETKSRSLGDIENVRRMAFYGSPTLS